MKYFLITLCLFLLFVGNLYAEIQKEPTELLFIKIVKKPLNLLPKYTTKNWPDTKKIYISFVAQKKDAEVKSIFLNNIKNKQFKNELIDICKTNRIWEFPLSLNSKYKITLDKMNSLLKEIIETKNVSHKEMYKILFIAYSINYFSLKLAHGAEYNFNKKEKIIFSEFNLILTKFTHNKNDIIRLWALIISGYNYGLQKKWEKVKISLKTFNKSPLTWNIQPFVNGILKEIERKKYK